MPTATWKALAVLLLVPSYSVAQPIARLVVPHPKLTLNRTNGEISLIARVEAVGSFTGTRKFRIGITPAANPSGVVLESGAEGKLCEFSLKAATSEDCVLAIATSPKNHQSGMLKYSVHLKADEEGVQTEGSPQEVVVTTVPY